MAYREVDMWEILEVLRRAGQGESITQIKLATGRSRKTIRRYVRLARKLGWVLWQIRSRPKSSQEPSSSA